MKTQRLLGIVFLLLGIAIIAASLVPEFIVPRSPVVMSLLITGIIVAVFGAFLVPSSGAAQAGQQLIVVIQQVPVLGTFFGRRAGDTPQPPKP